MAVFCSGNRNRIGVDTPSFPLEAERNVLKAISKGWGRISGASEMVD
jgi:hypothetical protein